MASRAIYIGIGNAPTPSGRAIESIWVKLGIAHVSERKCSFFLMGIALFAVVCLNGCYAGVGPSVGFVPHSRTPTLGWEASAAAFTFAKSYALEGGPIPPGSQTWTSRTYLMLEPRLGIQVFEDEPRFFAGGGGALGVQWTHDPSLPEANFGMQAGAWGGGVWAISSSESIDSCDRNDRAYVSLAIGARGDEFYVTPKVGWMVVPNLVRICAVNRRR